MHLIRRSPLLLLSPLYYAYNMHVFSALFAPLRSNKTKKNCCYLQLALFNYCLKKNQIA